MAPCHSGSTLVSHNPVCIWTYQPSAALHLSTASAPGSSDPPSILVLGNFVFPLDACHRGSALVSSASSVARSFWLAIWPLGSPNNGSISVGGPLDVACQVTIMAAPSINSSIGYHPGSGSTPPGHSSHHFHHGCFLHPLHPGLSYLFSPSLHHLLVHLQSLHTPSLPHIFCYGEWSSRPGGGVM